MYLPSVSLEPENLKARSIYITFLVRERKFMFTHRVYFAHPKCKEVQIEDQIAGTSPKKCLSFLETRTELGD